MQNKNTGKTATILLGLLLTVSAGIFIVLSVAAKPPELSQEKMQRNLEAAEKTKRENAKQTENTQEDAGSEHTASIKAFQVTTAGQSGTVAENPETEKEATGQDEDTETGSVYLCSYSSQRLMTEADVQELQQRTYEGLPQGKGMIRMVVNELYARYGYQFGNEEIQGYFDQQEWYQNIPTRSTDMNEIIKKMTDTERENVEFLSPYIEEE